MSGDRDQGSKPRAPGDAIRQLRERYRNITPQLVEAFRALALRLVVSPTERPLLDELCRDLHRLHGTAGSYGYHEASRLAAALETRATGWCADATLEAAERAAVVVRFASSLEAAFRTADAATHGV
jgi:chemotaxis protein histidine kinase CheA